MRVIKYRAWLIEEKKIYYWNPYFFSDTSPVTGYGGEFPSDESDIILMQFTGLKDRNSKEGYEGDIISRQYEGDRDTGIIEFQDGCFRIKWMKELLFTDTLKYHLPEGEIIGNVYENPELLNNSKAEVRE